MHLHLILVFSLLQSTDVIDCMYGTGIASISSLFVQSHPKLTSSSKSLLLSAAVNSSTAINQATCELNILAPPFIEQPRLTPGEMPGLGGVRYLTIFKKKFSLASAKKYPLSPGIFPIHKQIKINNTIPPTALAQILCQNEFAQDILCCSFQLPDSLTSPKSVETDTATYHVHHTGKKKPSRVRASVDEDEIDTATYHVHHTGGKTPAAVFASADEDEIDAGTQYVHHTGGKTPAAVFASADEDEIDAGTQYVHHTGGKTPAAVFASADEDEVDTTVLVHHTGKKKPSQVRASVDEDEVDAATVLVHHTGKKMPTAVFASADEDEVDAIPEPVSAQDDEDGRAPRIRKRLLFRKILPKQVMLSPDEYGRDLTKPVPASADEDSQPLFVRPIRHTGKKIPKQVFLTADEDDVKKSSSVFIAIEEGNDE